MRIAAEVQLQMFESISALGCEGVTELELTASAEAISRAAGFGARFQCVDIQCNVTGGL